MAKIIVPKARRVTDEGMPVFDKKGRPVWSMPRPAYKIRHFKNAAMRRKFENGEVDRKTATVEVPVFRGLDSRTFRSLKRAAMRKQRKTFLKKLMDSAEKAAAKSKVAAAST